MRLSHPALGQSNNAQTNKTSGNLSDMTASIKVPYLVDAKEGEDYKAINEDITRLVGTDSSSQVAFSEPIYFRTFAY